MMMMAKKILLRMTVSVMMRKITTLMIMTKSMSMMMMMMMMISMIRRTVSKNLKNLQSSVAVSEKLSFICEGLPEEHGMDPGEGERHGEDFSEEFLGRVEVAVGVSFKP